MPFAWSEVCSKCGEEFEEPRTTTRRTVGNICRVSQQDLKADFALKATDNCPLCKHQLGFHPTAAAGVAVAAAAAATAGTNVVLYVSFKTALRTLPNINIAEQSRLNIVY